MITDRRAIDGLDHLAREVGHGHITAICRVDQPYAHRQHEELTWKHPHGGRAKYLEGPLFENAEELVHKIAGSLLTETGSHLREVMIEVAEKLSTYVEENAPVLTGELKNSGHPFVEDEEFGTIYDRPPRVPRIDADQHKPTQH